MSILGRSVLSNNEILTFNYIGGLISAFFDQERLQNMVAWSDKNKAAYDMYTEAKFLAAGTCPE